MKNATEVDWARRDGGGRARQCVESWKLVRRRRDVLISHALELLNESLKVAVFEACSASIAARATDLIGIYESDNGRKGE